MSLWDKIQNTGGGKMQCLLSVSETGVLDYFQHTHECVPALLEQERDPPRQLINSPEPRRGTEEMEGVRNNVDRERKGNKRKEVENK